MKEAWTVKPESIKPEEVSAVYDADIVVIGAGHAGTCAARAGAEAGASVIVIEQQEREKQWVLGIGEIGHINSKWQKEHGIPEVDIDTFVNDWQLRTGNRSLYPLIRSYALHGGETFDWFIEPLTTEEKASIHPVLTPASPNMPETLNGFHAWPGTPNMGMELQTKAVKANHRLAEEHGARFFFSTRAVQLEQAENGCVTGVYAKDAEGKLGLYRARKGVVLAAGDYSKNADMCRYLLTEAADLTEEGSDFTGHGWDGSGICMGLWTGGRLEPNGQLWAIFDDTIREQVTFQTPCHGLYDYTDAKERENFEAVLTKAKSQRGQAGQKGSAALDKDRAGETRPLYCADTLEELAGLIFKEKED